MTHYLIRLKCIKFRLIGSHLFAILILTKAFEQLSWLYNFNIVEGVLSEPNTTQLIESLSAYELNNFLLSQQIFTLLGLFVGIATSFFLAIKWKQAIINPVITIILAVFLNRIEFLNIEFIDTILTFIGSSIKENVFITISINFIILTSLSSWIFIIRRNPKFEN